MKKLAVIFCVLGLTACTYKVNPTAVPSYDLVTAYSDPVPGLWLLYIDASALQRPIKPDGYACAVHSYPIEMAEPFRSSMRQTLKGVMAQIEEVQSPPTLADVAARKAKGFVIVRGEEVRARIEMKPGFFMNSMYGDATVVASVTVDGKEGRMYGRTFQGDASGAADAGFACEGGAKGLAEAASKATGRLAREIGEGLSNEPRLRGNNS